MHSGHAGVMDQTASSISSTAQGHDRDRQRECNSVEVENAISLMPEVAEVAVIGIPDDTWGEAVHTYVVPKESSELSLENVQAFCRAHLASFKCPRSAEIRSQSLLLSGAGRILKAELRKAILVREGVWVNWRSPTFECRGGKGCGGGDLAYPSNDRTIDHVDYRDHRGAQINSLPSEVKRAAATRRLSGTGVTRNLVY
jgi:hypothetical protein